MWKFSVNNHLFCVFLIALATMLSGCAFSPLADPPRFNLTNIQVQQIGLIEQSFLLTLKIQNPNDKPLNIQGMSFDLDLNGDAFASGVSNQAVYVAGFSEATVDVNVSSSLGGIMDQFQNILQSKSLRYLLKGKMKLEGISFTVPFKQSGEVALFSRPD